MASSMITGDRRWGQTRKSGMTVLGKVPKPINLPSQRLENHGLDPNVEIVPKGTLTWGSRSSLSASNAWGSSSLPSPNTDGSSASPSCLSGRPSSGGSYTRPSTAASDRSHQALSSAWGPNSRPSSASGILPSSQTSAAVTRPRSAETRPGSSQFSCFVEPAAESSAWGATRSAEKLVPASRPNSFTLSSGDFPTLGSEKNPKSNALQQGHSSQGRPASASGRVSAQKETTEPTPAGNQTIVQLDKGNLNTWRRDNSTYTGSAVPPSTGNWNRDQQQTQTYQHANVPSQQFDSWLGPPMQSSSDGIWYRGGPPGGVYRPGGPTGSYPIEPYIYYPHLPARPLPNSQTGPSHGAVAGGYGPMNGVPFRPHTPDSFMVPNHPIGPMRPEAYPRQVHYESYYGHPPNLGNGSEHDGPVLRMAPCSVLSNKHPNQNSNLDSGNFHAVPCYYAPSMANEKAGDAHAHESSGPQYKVLLKQHDGCRDLDSEENTDQPVRDGVALVELGASSPAQRKGGKDEHTKMGFEGAISQPAKGSEIYSLVPAVHENADISTKSEIVDDHCVNSASKGADSQRLSAKRSSTLIEKIESLNNKARLADSRPVVPAFVGEVKNKQLKNLNVKLDSTKVPNTSAILPDKSSAEKVFFDGVMENKIDTGDPNLESAADVHGQLRASEIHTSAVGLLGPSDVGLAAQSTHKRDHSKQDRADYHAKSQFNTQDVEEWRKKSSGRDSSVIDCTENLPELRVQDCQPSQDVPEKKELNQGKVGDEKYFVSSTDPADYKAQHDKMREFARQRAKQLQKEEEERIREQKARALAKLEELNRRTLAESSNQTVHPPSIEIQSVQDAKVSPEIKANSKTSEASNFDSGSSNAVVQKAAKVTALGGPPALLTNEVVIMLEESVDPSPRAVSLPVTHNDPSMALMQDAIKIEAKADSQFHDNGLSKQKQMPHKSEDDYSEGKHVFDNVSIGVMVGSIIVGSKNLGGLGPQSSSSGDGLPNNNKDVDEPSMQHKKRNNRTTRNKNRLEEAPSSATLQSTQKVLDNVTTDCCRTKPAESVVEDTPVAPEASNETVGVPKSSDLVTLPPIQGSSQGTTVASGKATVQWRPQPPRRPTRNSQATQSADKFHGTEAVVWAPVRLTNKKVPSEEMHKVTSKANSDSSGKNGNDVELNLKYKRAEMERYVPKPIAKELSQQENLQRPSSPSQNRAAFSLNVEPGSLGTTDSGLDHSATVKVETPANMKNGENNKPNKHGRTHTSWRRRGPPESSSSLGLREGSSFDSNKDTQKASSLQQPSKPDDSQKEQPKFSDDGWNDNNYLMQSEPVAAHSVEKDHAKINRGRRQPFKGHKVVDNGSSRDNWEPGHGRTDKAVSHMMTMEADESAGRKNRNENQSAGDHLKSQWQPKSQASSTPNHCPETKGTGVQRIASQGNKFAKESPLPGGGNHNQLVEGQSILTAASVSAEVRNVGQREVRRERRGREFTMTANQDSATVPELVAQNAEPQNEPFSSGSRRHGQRSGWFAKGRDSSFGGEGGVGQDAGKHNLPANVDRRRLFQRTGYYDKQSDSFQHNSAVGEEAQNVSKSLAKYRERSHSHTRRGGGDGGQFYSRNRNSDAYGTNGE